GRAGGRAGPRRPTRGGRGPGGPSRYSSTRVWRAAPVEHDPEKACPGLDPGWMPVFGKACPRARPEGSCSNNKVERDGDSKKSHLALEVARRIAGGVLRRRFRLLLLLRPLRLFEEGLGGRFGAFLLFDLLAADGDVLAAGEPFGFVGIARHVNPDCDLELRMEGDGDVVDADHLDRRIE